jgi:hypothetical protein
MKDLKITFLDGDHRIGLEMEGKNFEFYFMDLESIDKRVVSIL